MNEAIQVFIYWYLIYRQAKCEKRDLSDTSLRKNYGSYGTEGIRLPYLFLLYLRTLLHMYTSRRVFIIVKNEFPFFFLKYFRVFSVATITYFRMI